MRGIGNDIIDIQQTKLDSNWKRKGFVQKVFSLEEQAFIQKSTDPFTTVWRMWSMKESAYKLFLQNNNTRFFNPSKIACTILSNLKGKVLIGDFSMHTFTEIHSKYISTTAFLDDINSFENSIFHLDKKENEFQSKFTHQQFINYFADKNLLQQEELEIKKTSQNIPQLFYKKQKLNIHFSFSHHGNYGAFSILNNQND